MEENKEPILEPRGWSRRVGLQAAYAKGEGFHFAVGTLRRELPAIEDEVDTACVSHLNRHLFSGVDGALGAGDEGVLLGGAVVDLDRDPGLFLSQNEHRKLADGGARGGWSHQTTRTRWPGCWSESPCGFGHQGGNGRPRDRHLGRGSLFRGHDRRGPRVGRVFLMLPVAP